MAKPTRLAKGIAKKVNPKLKFNRKPLKELGVDSYRGMNRRAAPHDGLEHDHIPSQAALIKARENKLGRPLTKAERRQVANEGTTVAVRNADHARSRTYRGRNTPEQIAKDAKDLRGAQERDLAVMRDTLEARGYSADRIERTMDAIRRRNRGRGI